MADVVTLGQADVLRWRLRRLLIDPVSDQEPVEVARRLCGIQAQVPSAAELAVAARALSPNAAVADLRCALVDGWLLRTWAVRGTLHLLPPDVAARQLSLLADARTWQREARQRAFAPISVMAVLAAGGRRCAQIWPAHSRGARGSGRPRLDDPTVSDHLRSGWSALLKPLAWQGVLCQGPSRGSKVTFARPEHLVAGWRAWPTLRRLGMLSCASPPTAPPVPKPSTPGCCVARPRKRSFVNGSPPSPTRRSMSSSKASAR